MKFNSINLFSYLIFLLPIALVTGPFIPELIVLFCNIFFLFKVIQEKKFSYFRNDFFKIFLFFWLILNVSALLSEDILFSLKYSFFYIRFGIFVLAVTYLIENNKNFIRNFYIIFIFTLSLILFDSYFQYIFNFNIFGFERYNNYMVSGFFNDELILGTYLMRFSPLLIALYFYVHSKKNTKFNSYLFYIAIIFPMIFLSGQRTPFFLSIIFLISTLIILKLNKNKILSLFFSFIIIFSNILVDNEVYTGQGTGYKNRMITDIIYNHNKITENQKKEIKNYKYIQFLFISPGHNTMWLTALKLYEDKKLFGHGPNTFRKECKTYVESLNGCNNHPHSYIFQILAEIGLVGVLFYFILYFYIIKKILSYYLNLNNNPEINYYPSVKILLYLSFLINFAPFIPSGNFFNNHQNIMIFLPIGFLVYFLRNKKND